MVYVRWLSTLPKLRRLCRDLDHHFGRNEYPPAYFVSASEPRSQRKSRLSINPSSKPLTYAPSHPPFTVSTAAISIISRTPVHCPSATATRAPPSLSSHEAATNSTSRPDALAEAATIATSAETGAATKATFDADVPASSTIGDT